ncbi:MAG: alpha/beta hydrolase [Sphingomonadaceae bacterium]|uniref:alpha/beta hydrolase family protein n=1 Tax=Thermaurantiacus sp. TaxID=2820283 RepID=UPI00298F17B5|nr:alpha/beta hydrolase [Thermaurantiacus sp.]MCS6987576.1 alpha/beta hydrolase [Sphingomonadaceae bacterium]MDW8415177.1 alpha/beta hydrolase [Thermaurantiacus sp.]
MRPPRRALLAALVAGLAARALGLGRKGGALPPPDGPSAQDLEHRGTLVRLWTPAAPHERTRAVAFSHGANASARRYDELCHGLAEAGHAVAAVTHPDSPEHPASRRPTSPADGWRQRLADLRAALDLLATRFPGRPLAVAGHSYGALVAQALGGARVAWAGDGGPLPDPRVRRVVAFSPPGPLPSVIGAEGFAAIAVPLFVATGTADVVPPVATTWEAHLASFEAATISPRWAWVGDRVDHYFGNRIGRPERAFDERQARLFGHALAAAVAFLEELGPPPAADGVRLLVR